MTGTTSKQENPAEPAPKKKLASRTFGRAAIGGAVGALAGYFLVEGIPGAAFGAVLGWYLVRSLWGAVVGGIFGWFFVHGVSGAAAGMVVGVMIALDIIGRKGRWIVLATVLTISVVSILSNESWRKQIMRWMGL